MFIAFLIMLKKTNNDFKNRVAEKIFFYYAG